MAENTEQKVFTPEWLAERDRLELSGQLSRELKQQAATLYDKVMLLRRLNPLFEQELEDTGLKDFLDRYTEQLNRQREERVGQFRQRVERQRERISERSSRESNELTAQREENPVDKWVSAGSGAVLYEGVHSDKDETNVVVWVESGRASVEVYRRPWWSWSTSTCYNPQEKPIPQMSFNTNTTDSPSSTWECQPFMVPAGWTFHAYDEVYFMDVDYKLVVKAQWPDTSVHIIWSSIDR